MSINHLYQSNQLPWKKHHFSMGYLSVLKPLRSLFVYVVASLVVIIGMMLYLSIQINRLSAPIVNQYTAQAKLTANSSELTVASAQGAQALNALLQRWSTALHGEATVMHADGTVLATSRTKLSEPENLNKLPEVQAALQQGQGQNLRNDAIWGGQTFFIAFLVQLPNHESGVLRWAFPLAQVTSELAQFQTVMIGAMLLVSGLLIGFVIFQVNHSSTPTPFLTKPVEQNVNDNIRIPNIRIPAPAHTQTAEEQPAVQKETHSELQQKRIHKLLRERTRLHAVLNELTEGVLLLDKQGCVRQLNSAAAQLLQVPLQSEAERTFAQISQDARIVQLWERCQQTGQPASGLVTLATKQSLHVQVTPFAKSNVSTAQKHGYLVILQDQTQLHQLETVRQDFIDNASYELRLPLTSIRALVDTLNDGALEDPTSARRFLKRLDHEVGRLGRLVQALFELARLEAGKMPLVIRPTPLARAVTPALESMRTQVEQASLTLKVDLPSNLPRLLMDADFVQQVFVNLLQNALKSTPAGGLIELSARAESDDATVTVMVKDSGHGIPGDILPRIFERFYKVDAARSTSSFGLGLTIAKYIIQAHGGRMWAESESGAGSTFYFSLPAAAEDAKISVYADQALSGELRQASYSAQPSSLSG